MDLEVDQLPGGLEAHARNVEDIPDAVRTVARETRPGIRHLRQVRTDEAMMPGPHHPICSGILAEVASIPDAVLLLDVEQGKGGPSLADPPLDVLNGSR